MTYDEIVTGALERVREFGQTAGMANATMLKRIGLRQSQLFMRAAEINPDFFGTCVIGTLDASGGCDLALIVDPLNPIGMIERIEVADAGTSTTVAAGDPVTVVPLNDALNGLAPRVTLRDMVVKQVGTDLAGVASLEFYYSKLSMPVSPTSGSVTAQLREPFVDLLVLDLAQYILKFVNAEGGSVEGPMKLLADEETALTGDFEKHIRGVVLDPADRFRRFGDAAG